MLSLCGFLITDMTAHNHVNTSVLPYTSVNNFGEVCGLQLHWPALLPLKMCRLARGSHPNGLWAYMSFRDLGQKGGGGLVHPSIF